MKKSYGLIVLLLIGIVLITRMEFSNEYEFVPSPQYDQAEPIPKIEPEKATISSKENPDARRAYEQAMLVDPQSGELPLNIKRREHRYSSKLPRKKNNSLRIDGTNSEDWRSIGPYNVGGRARAIAIDISNENIILAGGVSGGMWRSEDDGSSWEKTTVPQSIHSVSSIAQDIRPGKQNIWYYGTGEFTSNSASKKGAPFRGDGVFKSVDGGNTWGQLLSTAEGIPNYYNSQFQYVWNILPNPDNTSQDEVFLATVGAIFRSTNGGLSWNVVLGRKLESTPTTDLNNSFISDYATIAMTEKGIFYAVLSQKARSGTSPDRGVYRSSDGVEWARITPRIWPRNYARTIIAASKSNPDEIYFSINDITERLIKFTNTPDSGNGTGGIWEDLTENLPEYGGEVGNYDSQDSYNMVLEVHPAEPHVVFLGGTNLYRSTDGFSSENNTTWIGGYDTANNIQVFPNHFVDQHGLVFYPSNPDKMLSSNDGGVFVTEENNSPGIYWTPLNNGFVTSQFYSVGLDEFGSRGNVIGGLQDNGTMIANKPVSQSSWNRILSGDGGYAAITKNELFHFSSFQFGKIYRFTLDKNNQTQTFTRIDPYGSGGEDKLLFVNPYVLAPENQHIMYYAGGNVVWRNLNTSQIPLYKNYAAHVNWEKLELATSDHGTISAIKASYNPSGLVYYATTTGELYRINNANQLTYSVDEITSSSFPENGYISSIAIGRKDSKNIAVSFSNYNVISLFYSIDGGETFENISGNMEENPDGSGSGPSVRWVEIVSKKSDHAQLFIGTSTGVYSTSAINGNNTIWEQEGAETVGNVLVTMINYFSADGTIVACTHGNGLFEATLNDVWQTELNNYGEQFALRDAFPNPFSNSTNIPFMIPRDGMVRARIFNSLGQLIKTLLWAEQFAGENTISWDGTNEAGVPVISGTYICRLEFEDQKIGNKLIYMN